MKKYFYAITYNQERKTKQGYALLETDREITIDYLNELLSKIKKDNGYDSATFTSFNAI